MSVRSSLPYFLSYLRHFSVHVQPREGSYAVPDPDPVQGSHSQGRQGPPPEERGLQVHYFILVFLKQTRNPGTSFKWDTRALC